MADPVADDALDRSRPRPPSPQATADADADEKSRTIDPDSAEPSQQKSKVRDSDAAPSKISEVRRWAALIPPLAGIGLCIPLWLTTDKWGTPAEGGPGPAFYPRLLIALFALCMVVRIVQEIRAIRRGVAVVDEDEEVIPEEGAELEEEAVNARRVAIVIAIAVAYVVASVYLGWVIATFLVVVVFLVLAGKRNLLIVVPLAAALSIGFAYMFVKVVYLSLPTGVGFFDDVSVRLFELLGAY
jgi:putative tricarboxylic transport membrane protein